MGKENRYQTVNREGKDLKVEAIRPGEWGKENQGKWCWEVEWVETSGHGRLKVGHSDVGQHRPYKNGVFWGGKAALRRDRGRNWLV